MGSFDDPFAAEDAPQVGRAPDPIDTIVAPLWRARRTIAITMAAGLCLGGFLSLLQPNEFSSIGKFLVRAGEREAITPEGRVIGDGGASISINTREAVANQIHLVNDPSVFQRVVADVGAPAILAPYDPSVFDDDHTSAPMHWMHQFQRYWFGRGASCFTDSSRAPDNCPRCVDAAEQVVAHGINVFAEPGSSVLSVAYASHSPQLASTVVNAYLRAALAHHQQVFDVDNELQFLDEQVLQARSAADLADDRLAKYRTNCGLYNFETQSAAILSEINTLESEIAAQETRLVELRRRAEFYDSALEVEPKELRNELQQPPILNPKHGLIESHIFELRSQLAALESDRTSTKDQIETRRQVLSDQIAQQEIDLAKEPRFLQVDPVVQVTHNSKYDELLQNSRAVHAEIAGIVDSQSLRSDRISALRDERDRYEDCRPRLATLERESHEASAALSQFVARREQASLVNKLDSTHLTNLRILQEATLPRTKSGPKRGRSVMIGGVLGAAIGVAWALARNFFASRRGRFQLGGPTGPAAWTADLGQRPRNPTVGTRS